MIVFKKKSSIDFKSAQQHVIEKLQFDAENQRFYRISI